MLRGILVRLFRNVVRLYFRRIERVGESPPAETAGRLFVSNHHNALVDPILVLTDTECIISPVAKSTLWSIPGLRWLLDVAEAVPIMRRKDFADKDAKANDATFERIAGHLAHGGNILIFPEGKSHSEPKVAKLRTGAARMLMLADGRVQDGRANDAPAVELTFQAVALEFDQRDKFRSRCLVLWGPVRKLADVPGEGEERIRGVTDLMAADLSELLVEGETHEERLLIARVAEMLANDAGHQSLERWNEFGRLVELASRTFATLGPTSSTVGGSAIVDEVGAAVRAYYGELEKLGLRDWQLSEGRAVDTKKSWLRWVRRAATVPFAVPGIVLFSVPYLGVKLVSRITTNRPEAGDVISTAKLATGFLAHPVWAAVMIAVAWWQLPTWMAATATVVILIAPFAALAWLDAWESRVPGLTKVATPERIQNLMTLRAAALGAIATARAKLPSPA